MTVAFLLVGAVLLVAFGGLMAAIDAAFGVRSRTDLEEMGTEGRNAQQLARIAADPDAHVNAVAFIRVLSETTAAVLVTVAFSSLFDNIWWAMLAAAVLMTGITFVLVGASPRTFGRHHADRMLRACAPVVRGVRIILGPLAQGLVVLGNRVTPGAGRSTFSSEEQLLSMVDEAASNDLIEEDDRDLIHSVFDFTDQFVRAVMVPRTEMVAVDATATTSEAMALFLHRGVSRMPVVDDEADDVVGVLYLKDLVQFAFRDESAWRTASIRPISRPATFVPESMRAETLLQQMKRDAVHVCLVIDEHGGISGLVTLEDLIEELVGEISDEYDQVSAEVVDLGEGRYRVSARLPLEDVGDLFGLELEDEDVDSIGGLLGKALGQVPQPGATTIVDGLLLTGGASRGRGRGIATVFVERAPGVPDEGEADDD
ncbi:Magnesium and cobalt efflux protein CorC [Microbacterium hydrocarbonoxydans]|jgi:CBS domain containing-hemolysin-like protein|uniref:Magnesium and cobalt efflux protein CorC n=1 Tax=Microbacterium hydrocarbonoxydans TaxID=273678 RepID=A0A0M2HHI4_9MICO|nr:hemolysin family protein [Microbacterium hydrocarbonoxydans]KJL46149.1 Magnesium and cobalt efflux protein CorC [Microbacterium hydrocarbonoxydans]